MAIERGSQAFRLVQNLNAGASPPDHEGTLRFLALLLRPIYQPQGERHYAPRRV